MLRIFRSIRQRLLAENRFTRYLIYALGEIVLVVAGILIALQINNWNEQQKEKKQEVILLTQLNADLRANLNEIHGLYDNTIKRAVAADSIIYHLEREEQDTNRLKTLLYDLQYAGGIFNSATTAFRSIESGGTGMLSNHDLRVKIIEMYERYFYNIKERRDIEFGLIKDELMPVLREHLIPTKNETRKFLFGDIKVLNLPRDRKKLRNDKLFIALLSELQASSTIRKNRQAFVLQALEELIADVDEEILNLSK